MNEAAPLYWGVTFKRTMQCLRNGDEMTEKELNDYQLLAKKIVTLEDQLKTLKQNVKISSPKLTGLPHGSNISDLTGNWAIEIADMEERLQYLRSISKETLQDVIEFIDSIDDETTRLVFRFRVIQGCTWSNVAELLGGYNTKGSVRKRYFSLIQRRFHSEEDEPTDEAAATREHDEMEKENDEQ